MKLVFNTKYVWYINSNETSQTGAINSTDTWMSWFYCACNTTRRGMPDSTCSEGIAIQNLRARKPWRILLYTGKELNKFFVSEGKVSVTHLCKKKYIDSLLLKWRGLWPF